MTPEEYLKEHGLKDYDKHFECKKNHKYIDTCIFNDHKCVIPIAPVAQ